MEEKNTQWHREEYKELTRKPPEKRIALTRKQIFLLLREEDLTQLEWGQPPIYTHYINPNLP